MVSIYEVKNLGERLAAQTGNANLVVLGTEVTGFYGQPQSARSTQRGIEGEGDADATTIEAARLTMATALYGNLGDADAHFLRHPAQVTNLFDLRALRKSGAGNGSTPPANPPTPPPANP